MLRMERHAASLDSEKYLKQILAVVPHAVLGERVKALRINAGWSIRELANRALLSKTSIVSLEQGKSCRPVTLEKVCRALNLHVERLVGSPDDIPPIVQDSTHLERYALDDLLHGPLATELQPNMMLMFKNIPIDAGFIAGIVEVGASTDSRTHVGAEFGFVLEGSALLTIDGKELRVPTGSSFYIPSDVPHCYGKSGNLVTRILMFRLT